MKRYYYGMKDQEYYTADDIDDAFEEIKSYEYDDDLELLINSEVEIVEMVVSKRSGERWCIQIGEFTDECGRICCDEYMPRNGKNGICKHLSWGLIETGRKWLITGDYSYKKISKKRSKNHAKTSKKD
jgi:hypothetical protein